MIIRYIILVLVGICLFFIIGWLTGSKEYGGAKTRDDERSQYIKQKAIVNSWIFTIIFLIINFAFDVLNLRKEPLFDETVVYPELFYVLIAITVYFVYYWKYRKRMSSHEK